MKKNIPIDIIAGHLRGGNSASEEKLFEAWLSLDGSKDIFNDIVNTWNDTYCESNFGCGKDDAWSTLSERLNIDKKAPAPFGWRIIANIAAVAALVFVSIFSYKTISDRSEANTSLICLSNTSGKCNMTLPDGTAITLNSNSKITYGPDFGKKDRRVICEGRVFFDVAKNPEKPFIISVKDLQVKVTGTSFDVNSKFDEVVVSLVEGSVELSSEMFEGTKNMVKGDVASFNTQSGAVSIISKDVSKATLWCADHITFSGASLDELCTCLAEWYNVNVILSDELKSKGILSFTITNEPLDVVLSIIAKTTSINYRYEGTNTIIIY